MRAVNIIKLHPSIPLSTPAVRRYIRIILKEEKISWARLNFVFVTDRIIRRLNKKYKSKDRPTDVLAFDIGDIIISVDRARAAAKALQIPFKEELLRYIVHGILHLAGYDDTTAAKKKKMWKRQEQLLEKTMTL